MSRRSLFRPRLGPSVRGPLAARALLRTIARIGPVPAVGAAWLLGKLPEWLAPSRGRYDTTALGAKWTVDLADNLQRVLYFTGTYEPRLLSEVVRRLRSGDTVLDVGANVGTFAVPVAKHLQRLGAGQVIAVEPASDTASRLDAHVRSNRLADVIDVVRVAFGAETTTATLRSMSSSVDDTGVRSLYGDGTEVETIDVVRGDAWLADHEVERVDVLKVDVEGGEIDVLAGLALLLNGPHPPRVVVVEANAGHQSRRGGTVRAILDHVPADAYAVAWIRARGLRPFEGDLGRSGNLLLNLRDG
jgi:FkbM family methyltransferase